MTLYNMHGLTSSDEDEPAQRATRRRNGPPVVIEIDKTPPQTDDDASDSDDSARALSVVDCRSLSDSDSVVDCCRSLSDSDSVVDCCRSLSDSDAGVDDDDAPRRAAYSFSPQPAATPSLSVMKQTIKDAGLGIADLCEKQDVVARYALAQERLAAAARLKRSRDDDGAPAPKAPRVTPTRAPRPTAPPRARQPAQPPFGVWTAPRSNVRVVRNAGGVEGLHLAFEVCSEAVEIFEDLGSFPGAYEMAFRKTGARAPRDWRQMKNPSKKQDADGNWYGRAAKNVRSFKGFDWFDWAAIGFVRDHLCPGLALPDEIKYNQYIPRRVNRKHNALSPHFDPQGHYGERIVGFSVGADCTLVMQRCAKGHSRCSCKASEVEKICIPLPRRSMYIFEGRARSVSESENLKPPSRSVSQVFSPARLHARPRVAGEPGRAAGLESDGRAPVDDLPRGQGVECWRPASFSHTPSTRLCAHHPTPRSYSAWKSPPSPNCVARRRPSARAAPTRSDR